MARRPAGEINAGSMADISFLILCFFLMTSNMDQDAGLQRMLPPMADETQQQQSAQVNRRNILTVLINSNDRISAGGQPIDLSQIREKVRNFVLNETDDPSLPEKEVMDVPNFGTYSISKGVVALQNDRGTSYEIYLKVQNELVKAYNELREEFSLQHYGRPYLRLTETQQEVVRAIYKMNISESEPRDISGNKKR